MKKIYFVIVLVVSIVASSCNSSKRCLENGDYECAVEKSVQKLIKKPTKVKYIEILDKAYHKANTNDRNTIESLKKTGEPDIWANVFNLLSWLKERQNIVLQLDQSVLDQIGFVYIEYDLELIQAKKNAAAYFYARGEKRMNEKNKYSYRMAYDDFYKVKSYYYSYKDVDLRIQQALDKGTNNILVLIVDNSSSIYPSGFEDALLSFSTDELNELWLNYDLSEQSLVDYNYNVEIIIDMLDVSPELLKEKTEKINRRMQSGYHYEKDDAGEFVLDTLGHKIKVIEYAMHKCEYTEVIQQKSAFVKGHIRILDNNTSEVIVYAPLIGEMFFENIFGKAKGSKDVLSKKQKEFLKGDFLPFPMDDNMLLDAAYFMKKDAEGILSEKNYLLLR